MSNYRKKTHKMAHDLPDFERPPVNEVICGVTFKSLGQFLAPHIGQFWETIRGEFPKCREQMILRPVIEQFDPQAVGQLEFAEFPSIPRVWFLTDDETHLIQLQRDRFLYNWKQVKSEDQYPRFPIVMGGFETMLTKFEEFLRTNDLGNIEPTQFELSYVNHIAKGDGWTELQDVGHVFPDFSWRRTSRFLPPPEGANWHTTFTFPDKTGRLHSQIQHATRVSDEREILVFNLTARGIGASVLRPAMREWFEQAREWIVRGFADLTDENVQKSVWGRKR